MLPVQEKRWHRYDIHQSVLQLVLSIVSTFRPLFSTDLRPLVLKRSTDDDGDDNDDDHDDDDDDGDDYVFILLGHFPGTLAVATKQAGLTKMHLDGGNKQVRNGAHHHTSP